MSPARLLSTGSASKKLGVYRDTLLDGDPGWVDIKWRGASVDKILIPDQSASRICSSEGYCGCCWASSA